MSKRVLVTRPSEDGARLSQLLAQRGVEAVPAPFLDIHFLDGEALNLDGVQAVLLTSANGVRAFARRCAERDLPALCVGDATAREASAEGFGDVRSASGDVDTLADLVKATLDPTAGTLLHPAGSRVAGDLSGLVEAAGFSYRREVLYDAKKIEGLPNAASEALAHGTVDGVLLYSPRTGEAFARGIKDGGLGHSLATVTAYCLSPAVAETIKDLNWALIKVAASPDQDALLALL